MIGLVIAVMMIAQMLSPLIGGLLETAFGWRAIFYVHRPRRRSITLWHRARAAGDAARAQRSAGSGFRARCRAACSRSRAFVGYVLCQVLASSIIFTFAGGGPYVVVTQMGRTSAEYGAWFATSGFAYLVGNLFCVRFAPRHSLETADLVRAGAAIRRRAAQSRLGPRRDSTRRRHGCSAPR